jgi:hypothetical protein
LQIDREFKFGPEANNCRDQQRKPTDLGSLECMRLLDFCGSIWPKLWMPPDAHARCSSSLHLNVDIRSEWMMSRAAPALEIGRDEISLTDHRHHSTNPCIRIYCDW